MTRASESAMALKAATVNNSGSPGPAPTNVKDPKLGCGGAAWSLTAVRCGATRAGVQDVVTAARAATRRSRIVSRNVAAAAGVLQACSHRLARRRLSCTCDVGCPKSESRLKTFHVSRCAVVECCSVVDKMSPDALEPYNASAIRHPSSPDCCNNASASCLPKHAADAAATSP